MTDPRVTLERVLELPREAGTPAAAAARRILSEHLAACGFEVTEERFRFSPSALLGFPLFGALLSFASLMQALLLLSPSVPAWSAAAFWLCAVGLFATLAWGVGAGWSSLGPEREDANLVARRGPDPVRRWLVAHVDTKAQQQSMAGRLVTVWLLVVAIIGLTGIGLWRLRGPVSLPVVAGGVLFTLVACGLTVRARLRGTSPGARDNGSGLLAVLVAAERVPAGTAILLSGAEEFGLVGARIFVQAHRTELAGVEVINVDTVDDAGALSVVIHDARGRPLADRLAAALRPLALPAGIRRLPPGILVDSIPFARAGVPSVTIGRLNWHTLRRIHTPGDTAGGMSFATAVGVGERI